MARIVTALHLNLQICQIRHKPHNNNGRQTMPATAGGDNIAATDFARIDNSGFPSPIASKRNSLAKHACVFAAVAICAICTIINVTVSISLRKASTDSGGTLITPSKRVFDTDVEISAGHALFVDTINAADTEVVIEGATFQDSAVRVGSVSFDSGSTRLAHYSRVSVLATFSGPWVSANNPTRTLDFVRIGSMVVCSALPAAGVNTMGGTAAKIMTRGVVPAEYRSAWNHQFVIPGANNSTIQHVDLIVLTNGDLTISRNGADFDAVGYAGYRGFSVTWTLARE